MQQFKRSSEMKRISIIFVYLTFLIFYSCSTESFKRGVIVKRHDGVMTILSSTEFDNKKAYNIYLKGLKCIKKEKYKCAKKYLEKAMNIDPNNTTILCDLRMTDFTKRQHK